MDRTPVQHPEFRHGVRSCVIAMALLAAMAVGCVENHRQIKPVTSRFAWPTTVVADPAGDYVYVVSSNFDSESTGGTVIPVSTTTLERIEDGAIEIGSFSGEAVVTAADDGSTRFWVPSRDMDSLQFADIYRVGGAPVLFCNGESTDVEDGGDAVAGGFDASSGALPGFHACSGDYTIGLKQYPVTLSDGSTTFADNPYGVAAGGWATLDDGRRVQPIYVAGIIGAAIDVFLADDAGNVEFKASAFMDEGAHTVLEYMVTESDRVVWISNRDYNEIIMAHVHISATGDVELRVDSTVSADILGSSGDYFRGMARSQVGPYLYVAYRSPAGLAVFEITGDGGLRYRQLIPLEGDPSCVAVHVDRDGNESVYVTETSLDGVYVVDPVAMTVTETVFVGAAPYGIAIAGDRAFVANFEDSTVSVFGVEPGLDDYHVPTVIE